MTPLLALKQQPEAAFEAIYRRYVHDIYRYTLAVLGNPADAEDVTQTTFLNAYRAFHAGERPRKPLNWLRAIAHNVCRQRFRQAGRRPRELAVLDDVPDQSTADDADGPSAEDISRALRSLPFNQRAALVMRELEDRSQAEIAEALGLSQSAVEALLFRARRAMREQLESSIACGEAARAISRQLDRSLPREERAALRAHLRECPECASFARQMRAQRGVLRRLPAVPLPASLLSWSGGATVVEGTAAAVGAGGVGIGLKVAAGVVAAAVVAGAGGVGVHELTSGSTEKPAAQALATATGTPHARGESATAIAAPPGAVRSPATDRSGRHAGGRTTADGRAHHPGATSGRTHRAHGNGRHLGQRGAAPGQQRSHVKHVKPAKPPHPAHPSHPAHPPQAQGPPPKPPRPVRPHPPRGPEDPAANSGNLPRGPKAPTVEP